MTALFSRPKMPTIVQAPPPPPVPTIDQAADNELYSRQLRRRRGFFANQLSGQSNPNPSVAVRTLLG